MAVNETEQYVDWRGLRFYDSRIKEYIRSNTASKADKDQLRLDIEQLEQSINILANNLTVDKAHIYEHIEECKNQSATKEELQVAINNLHEEIKKLTGIDLDDYATIEFVEQRLAEFDPIDLPDNLVTTDDIQNLVTKDELAEEIGKITLPEIDLTSLATKEELSAVEAKIPSVEGLASETYVDEKVASIIIPEVPTKVGELENDAGYLTDVPEGYATESYVDEAVAKLVDSAPEDLNTLKELSDAISAQSDVLETFATKSQLENFASKEFVTSQISNIQIPSEYVTETELSDKGYLTDEDINNLATNEQIQAIETRVETFETTVNNTYIKLEDGVTKDDLETAVTDVVTSQVESIIDDKIESVLNDGAIVSAIAYDEF